MANTRLSHWAHLMRARVEAAGASPSAMEEAVAWARRAGHDLGPQGRVGCQDAMKANEMPLQTRHKGRQALEEFQRAHDEMGGAIAIRGFELEDDPLARVRRSRLWPKAGRVM